MRRILDLKILYLISFTIASASSHSFEQNKATYSIELVGKRINPYQFSFNIGKETAQNLFINMTVQHKIKGSNIPVVLSNASFFLNYNNLIVPMICFKNRSINQVKIEAYTSSLKLFDRFIIEFSSSEYFNLSKYKLIELNLEYDFFGNRLVYSHWNESIRNTGLFHLSFKDWKIDLGAVIPKNGDNRFCYGLSYLWRGNLDFANLEAGFLLENKRERILDLVDSIEDMDISINDGNFEPTWQYSIRFGISKEFEKFSYLAYIVPKFSNKATLFQNKEISLKYINGDSPYVKSDKWFDSISKKYFALEAYASATLALSVINLRYDILMNSYIDKPRTFMPLLRQSLSCQVEINGIDFQYLFRHRSEMLCNDVEKVDAMMDSNISISFSYSRLSYELKINNLFNSQAKYKLGDKIEGMSFTVQLGFGL